MEKNMSAPAAIFPKLGSILLGGGVLFGLLSVVPSPVAVVISILSIFMAYEDWTDQTIDIRLLVFVWLAFLAGSSNCISYLIRFVFIWLLFRCLFLWMMQFYPKRNDELSSLLNLSSFSSERLQFGYLPVFYLSFSAFFIALSFMESYIPYWLLESYSGYLMLEADIWNHPQLIVAGFVLLVVLCISGHIRRKKHCNENEIWPFGDGDVWFIATWGAALRNEQIFVICFSSQILLLILYLYNIFGGGDSLDE